MTSKSSSHKHGMNSVNEMRAKSPLRKRRNSALANQRKAERRQVMGIEALIVPVRASSVSKKPIKKPRLKKEM